MILLEALFVLGCSLTLVATIANVVFHIRAERAFQKAREQEALDDLKNRAENERRRRLYESESFSGWPFPMKDDE